MRKQIDITIKQRNLTFNLAKENIASWAGCKFITAYFNALSSMFPTGERFFINSLRVFKDKIEDGWLKKQVDEFIRQEASHAGFHEQYNKMLIRRGYKFPRMINTIESNIKFLQRNLRPEILLAITAANEHLTASLGDFFYHKIPTADWDAEYRKLWRLHMVEEIEHKAVTFDVYTEIEGRYSIRVMAIFFVILVFTVILLHRLFHVLRKEKQLWKMKTLWLGTKFFFGKNGMCWSVLNCAWQFVKPGFHPWDEQNYFIVKEFDQEFGI